MKGILATTAWSAILSTIVASVAVAQPAFNFEDIGDVRGWSVAFDQRNRTCAAYAGYESGTAVLFGLMGTDPVWFMELRNDRWESIQPDETYHTEMIFDGSRKWTGDQSGIVNGLWAEISDERLVEDFARSSIMEIRFKGTRVDRLNLTGTRAATNAIKECHASRIEQGTDPFAVANDDPFAPINNSSSETTIFQIGAPQKPIDAYEANKLPREVENFVQELETECGNHGNHIAIDDAPEGMINYFTFQDKFNVIVIDGAFASCGYMFTFGSGSQICGTGGCPVGIFKLLNNDAKLLYSNQALDWEIRDSGQAIFSVHRGNCGGSRSDLCWVSIDLKSGQSEILSPYPWEGLWAESQEDCEAPLYNTDESLGKKPPLFLSRFDIVDIELSCSVRSSKFERSRLTIDGDCESEGEKGRMTYTGLLNRRSISIKQMGELCGSWSCYEIELNKCP